MRNVSKEMSQVLDERIVSKTKYKCLNLLVIAALAALLCPSFASALPMLGPDLASFAVLGATGVTNVATSTIGGNLGSAANPSIGGGYVFTAGSGQSNTTTAQRAQLQLDAAILALNSVGAGRTIGADLTGRLLPGVYTVPAGATNLSGLLTLDGGGNANAAWVFQMESSLITSSNSVVNMINTGAGAGVFWNVRSSATIGTNSTFLGNLLALTSIAMNTGATDLCGRALASNGAVTLDQNTISGACTDTLLAGSNGLSGGLDIATLVSGGTAVVYLPFAPAPPSAPAPVPEPSTMLLLGSGLAGLVVFKKKSKKA